MISVRFVLDLLKDMLDTDKLSNDKKEIENTVQLAYFIRLYSFRNDLN